ncbi:rCG39072 [Rattus norvegicus]|uniref:RCG39072 n=1 Tax=Rattus norvegicus TaxID=10116 RepID=A6JXY2_RAT|nr:rCG39072 [Rattus norvegicus]
MRLRIRRPVDFCSHPTRALAGEKVVLAIAG